MARKKITRTLAQRDAFIAALSAGSTVSDAAKAAKLCKDTVYRWRKTDPDFSAAWDDAYVQGGDLLAKEAYRRAHDGVEEPVFHHGKVVGYVRKYSDTLLMFLLKAREPERYCDRARAAAILRRSAEQSAKLNENDMTVRAEALAILDRLANEKAAAWRPDRSPAHG